MAIRLGDARAAALRELRYEPTEKHIRATLAGATVVDSTSAVLVWEARRVLPSYAVPAHDLRGEVVRDDAARAAGGGGGGEDILHGAIPFAVHSSPGEAVSLRLGGGAAGGGTQTIAAYRLADPDLAHLVVLDFAAFDGWLEEDEQILAHPRDPFHRVDVRASSRHVVIELDGQLLADSQRPHLVFETSLPVRFYLPRQDVRVPLAASDKLTRCAYKGEASYWTFDLDGEPREGLVWSYEEPLPDATAIKGLVAFFDERVQVTVDGRRRGGELSAVAATIADEASI